MFGLFKSKPKAYESIGVAEFKSLKKLYAGDHVIENVEKMISESKKKDRFLVRLGNHIHSIKTTEIALFYAEGRTVYLVTNEHKKYILDYKLEELSTVLDATSFFRVNRTFIVNIQSIKDVVVYSNSGLKITTSFKTEKDIIVSREKVSAFKTWLEGS